MQTRNPLLNDFADLMTDALGAAQAMGEEARAAFRARADKFVSEMDLVTREEFDVVKAALDDSHAEVDALKARIAALEAAAKPKKTTTARKPAGKARPAKSDT